MTNGKGVLKMAGITSQLGSSQQRFAAAYTKRAGSWIDITNGAESAKLATVDEIRRDIPDSGNDVVALTFCTDNANLTEGSSSQRNYQVKDIPLILTGVDAREFRAANPIVLTPKMAEWTKRETQESDLAEDSGKRQLFAKWFEGFISFGKEPISISQKADIEDILSPPLSSLIKNSFRQIV
jgi:hypothetical protein